MTFCSRATLTFGIFTLNFAGVSAGAAPPPARPPAGAGRTGGAGGRGWVLRAEPLAGPPPPPGGRAGGGGVGGGAGGPGSLHSSALVPSTHTVTGVCVVLGAEYIQFYSVTKPKIPQ